jgi:uncharacterized protein (TIGR02453 family)
MIDKATIIFLKELKAHNSKEWFHANKEKYQLAKNNFLEVTEWLIAQIGAFDDAVRQSGLEAKQCIMRINRDIRFSKDKSPYKTNFFAYINRGGKKSPFAGYYLSIGANESFLGGGNYMPDKNILDKIRQEIDYNFEEFSDIIHNESFVSSYPKGLQSHEQLSRPPKGYEKENPAIEFLKYKGFYTQQFLSDLDLSYKRIEEKIVGQFKAVKPLVAFLNRAIEA